MPQPIRQPEPDPITADLAVLARSRLVMQQLLLRCVVDPFDAAAMEAAYVTQQMLAEDVAVVRTRLHRHLEVPTLCG